MKSEEIKLELGFNYQQLVEYLLNKYGKCQFDYFTNESCRSKNSKVSRTAEGLICHHIDEDKAIMLSTDKYAINNPYSYQKADRLVYCNLFEHLILHIKIAEEPKAKNANSGELQGIGGAINFLVPQINDFYNGFVFTQNHVINQMNLIKDNFEDYIAILKYLLKVTKNNIIYSQIVTPTKLSLGWEHDLVDKIFKRIK
jgi:hypothetical protein